MYVYMCVYIYIYIYIYVEWSGAERSGVRLAHDPQGGQPDDGGCDLEMPASLTFMKQTLYMYVYIYI